MRFISGFGGNSLKIMMQLPVVFFVLFYQPLHQQISVIFTNF